jgi:hypothetical protein
MVQCIETTTHAMMMAAQEKTQPYATWTSRNDFIALAIEMYGCLYFHFDSFLIVCAQTTIACYQQFSLIPLMPISHYQKHVSIALQCA